MSNLEGIGRFGTALHTLDEAIAFTPDDEYRKRLLFTKAKLLSIAVDVIVADLKTMERQMDKAEQSDD